MENQDLDKSHSATEYKLKKAKEKGQVAKSTDLVSATVFLVATAYFAWHGEQVVRESFRLAQAALLGTQSLGGSEAHAWWLVNHLVTGSLTIYAPLLLVLVLSSIGANLMQTGPMFTTEPLLVDFERVNPAAGFKRFFSGRTAFDAVKVCIKMVILSWIAYLALKSLAPQFYALSNVSASDYLGVMLADIASLGLKIGAVLLAIALLDTLYTRHEFQKKMRMSSRELKDEHKQRDGDPRIRARLRDLRKEIFKRSTAARKTKNADLLVTNPTHIAVALKYEHGKMSSPLMIAKGAGHMAQYMRQIAASNNIPVIQSPSLARQLYRELDVDQHVPQHLFADVARLVVWVFAMRGNANSGSRRMSPVVGQV